mgnify:CR=1 FL=1
MSYDELELDTLGDRKTALFIVTSDTDSTFDFVTALCVSQMMNVLCTKADDHYGGRLPIHVRCLFDEFANIRIPDMQRLIAVIRSREISASLILQSKSQLKAIYKDHASTIEGNCDSIFSGRCGAFCHTIYRHVHSDLTTGKRRPDQGEIKKKTG